MERKFSVLLAVLIIMWGCSMKPTDNPINKNGNLKPCPESPNCVSTLSQDSRHQMPALPYAETRDQSKERLVDILKSLQRSKIIEISDSYIHAVFRSRVFRFVDDVEFQFDDPGRLVHFRSASRAGYYDFGVNRRRMSEISRRYLAK